MTTDGFGDGGNFSISTLAVFNGALYAGSGNNNGAQIWRSGSGDGGDWAKVAPDEDGQKMAIQVTSFTVFKNALYAVVEANPGNPLQVWRSANGSAWETVVSDGFGSADNASSGGVAAYSGYLYVGTWNTVTGGQLWRTQDGVDWEQVIGDGFGDADNLKIEMLQVFASQFYTVVDNSKTGLKVLRSKDGVNWEQINLDGFGDSNNVAMLWNNSASKFKSQLYIGVWNTANGGEIWRYDQLERSIYLPLIRRE